ncbi:DUF6382 domain-containing protein [Paenibacillus sp. 32352]|uniref:DUF6382 domain-containing protein n=1 Tax=Paenibacillus sp. 32352 TaxID=1969111 RepID=UPI00277B5445|nr:DUF6382 domain-containing protein [Paenibacillus sp. 32352]
MNQSIYGLQVDYQNQNGHYMVLYKENGLRKDELSAFQMNMLLMNRIPRLLELHVEEVNHNTKLYYKITDKRMLSHWLRLGSLSIKQFFTLLYTIVDTLTESGVYMLEEGKYILKEDYIYCGNDLTDIYITYLPMETLVDKQTVSVDLQHLASRLVHKVTELSGSGYQELMNYLMDESFHLPALRQLLLKHMNQAGQERQDEMIMQQAALHRPLAMQAPELEDARVQQASGTMTKHEDEELPKWTPLIPFASAQGAAPDKGTDQGESRIPLSDALSLSKGESSLVPSPNKLKLPVMLIGILLCCLVWKLYLEHPGEPWLYICIGLTMFIADMVFVALWIWKPAVRSSEVNGNAAAQEPALMAEQAIPEAILSKLGSKTNKDQSSELAAFLKGLPKEPDAKESAWKKLSDVQKSFTPNETSSMKSPGKESDHYYQELEHRTTLLPKSDATVLLNSPISPAASAYPYLETNQSGHASRISLMKPCFVIGRAGDGVDYEHKETGVSRLHAEFVRENGQYGVKDLGSRNGTYVNNELLAPYRVYSLNDGDIVRIINTEFIFKMGL